MWSRVLYCCVFTALIVSSMQTIVPINNKKKAGKPTFNFLVQTLRQEALSPQATLQFS